MSSTVKASSSSRYSSECESDNFSYQTSASRAFLLTKALAQCQFLIGLLCFAFGAIYWVHKAGTRALASGVWCGLYFMLTAVVGICAAATVRRGALIAYIVMALHAAVLFAPALLIANAFGAYSEHSGCILKCHSEPLVGCQLACEEQMKSDWFSHMSSKVIDLGLITFGVAELCLFIAGAVFAFRSLSFTSSNAYVGEFCATEMKLKSNQIVNCFSANSDVSLPQAQKIPKEAIPITTATTTPDSEQLLIQSTSA